MHSSFREPTVRPSPWPLIAVASVALVLALVLARRNADYTSPTLMLPLALILGGAARVLSPRHPRAARLVLLAGLAVIVAGLVSFARTLLG